MNISNFASFISKICVTILIVLGCNSSKGEDNLLSNSSFETAGSGNLASSWGEYYDSYSRSDDFSIDGSWSCKITGDGTGTGLGGANIGIWSLPVFGRFTASSNIYIDSYTQGRIYDIYVTVNYTDSSSETFTSNLSVSEISANIDIWKNYSLNFTTDPDKTISSMTYWCLVWTEGTDKFIGTIYFDDVKLKVFKPVLYYHGEAIHRAGEAREEFVADVLDRGFTHVLVNQYDKDSVGDYSFSGNCALFLDGEGFEVVKIVAPTKWHLGFCPRDFSPYTNAARYNSAITALETMLAASPETTGIYDDIEIPTFSTTSYSIDGTASTPLYLADGTPEVVGFTDLQERIGNTSVTTWPNYNSNIPWPVFKDWPNNGDHAVDVNGDSIIDANDILTIEDIEYNFPDISIENIGTINVNTFLGYYASPSFTYQSYEMQAQTFKPVDTRITRIDIMIRRRGSSSAYPLGNVNYYLTGVDVNGKPDLNDRKSEICTIRPGEIDYSSSSWNDIVPLSLYFDPVAVGELDTDEQYAVVLEFTKKDNNDWNDAYYYMGGFTSDFYSNGQAWRRNNNEWVTVGSLNDFWFKIYQPDPPAGYALNQFHEDWIDFQCAVNARYVADYRSAADSASPEREVWIYSGYKGIEYTKRLHNYDATTRRAYSVDWEMLSAAGIDYAVCGYGIKSITDTVNALSSGKPSGRPMPAQLIGGSRSSQIEFDNRYSNCNGVMLYYGSNDYNDDPGFYVSE